MHFMLKVLHQYYEGAKHANLRIPESLRHGKRNENDIRPTYCAHKNALSSASKLPPMKGAGGFGSKAIHQPTGILTVFIPCLYRKSKSSIVTKVFLCFCRRNEDNK